MNNELLIAHGYSLYQYRELIRDDHGYYTVINGQKQNRISVEEAGEIWDFEPYKDSLRPPNDQFNIQPMKWNIYHDNDTGPDDEGFWEWWIVTDGKRSFECNTHEDATWLAEILNALPQ